jgi:hypothetical protein
VPASDCELIGPGFLGQPVNALTALVFVVAGLFVLRRSPAKWVGYGLIATGLGSFLFHGPMWPGSEWAHDVTLAWLILLIAGIGQTWERWTRLPGLVVLGAVFAVALVVADPLAVALVVVAAIFQVRRDPRSTLILLGAVGALGILGRLGATGGPLCDPDSLLQPHGLWHVGAAVMVAWWAMEQGADHHQAPS